MDAASIDTSRLFFASRWGKGGGADYLNIPLTRAEYETFVTDLLSGEKGFTPSQSSPFAGRRRIAFVREIRFFPRSRASRAPL